MQFFTENPVDISLRCWSSYKMTILCRKHYIICVIVRLWLSPPLTGSWRLVRVVLSPCAPGPRTWTSGAAWPRVTFVTEAATFVTMTIAWHKEDILSNAVGENMQILASFRQKSVILKMNENKDKSFCFDRIKEFLKECLPIRVTTCHEIRDWCLQGSEIQRDAVS